jgi:glycine cleavage system H protein
MDRFFSKDHEWITVDGNDGTIGISDYAQKQLGDIVYVSLTKNPGESVSKNDDVAEIESVKSVSQVFAPVSGEILEVNPLFENESNSVLINEDPYGKGWILKMKLSKPEELKELMNEEKYQEFLKTL